MGERGCDSHGGTNGGKFPPFKLTKGKTVEMYTNEVKGWAIVLVFMLFWAWYKAMTSRPTGKDKQVFKHDE